MRDASEVGPAGPSGDAVVWTRLAEALAGCLGEPCEPRILTGDGSARLEALAVAAERAASSVQALRQRLELAERQAKDELRKLWVAVEQSPATVVITSTSGKIEYVNPKFERVTGYSREEALGQNPRILKSGMQSEELYAELWAAISGGREWRGVDIHDGGVNRSHARGTRG
jgi:PAS domain S-box-containing protein